MSQGVDVTDVLIVGAGPTGLVLAIELARRNIPLRIVDSKAKPSKTSRSFTIHARTLEMFEDMGIAEKFVCNGYKLNGFAFNFQGQTVRPKLEFHGLDTPFPFILSVSQTVTERLLLEHLEHVFGVKVEWGSEVVRLVSSAGGEAYSAVIRGADGTEERSSVKWIIGCDGQRSTVRREAGLEFEGDMYEDTVMQLMDTPVSGFEWAEDAVHYYMSKDRFLLLARLPHNSYRAIVSYKGGIDDNDKEKARELFQDVVNSLVDGVTLGTPTWVSKWRVWKIQASKYRHRNVIIAGDAAHVLSPAGGQGMNCGMQDAYNIGWKLALVVSGGAGEELLDSYESERKAIGAQVIAGADAIHNILMAHGKGVRERLEVTQQEGWHAAAVRRISGVSYRYGTGAWAGERVGDAQLGTTRLRRLLCGARFTLLLTRASRDDAAGVVRAARAALGGALRVVCVQCGRDAAQLADSCDSDADGQLRARLGDKPTALLVRPDGYAAAADPLPGAPRLRRYLSQFSAQSL